MKRTVLALAAAVAFGGSALAAQPTNLKKLSGTIKVDGSSTVYPITEAVAEEFKKEAPRVNVTVGVSGTGGGFKRFSAGEIDVSDASRPIKKAEHERTAAAGIEYIELPVAYDGLTIVVNPRNTWVDQLSVEDLRKIFLAERAVKTWKDVNPAWPAEPIKIYSPGTDSGTFDYFKEVIAGDTGAIRSDMSVSEDDNVLVRGVMGDLNAIGFFGVAYYEENRAHVRAVPIVNNQGTAVEPSSETIEDGTYNPFSRPLFIYVSKKSAAKPVVRAFVEYYLENAPALAAEVGYVALPESVYEAAKRNLAAGRTGTRFLDAEGKAVHGAVTDVYK